MEHLVAWYAGFGDGLADLGFIAVDLSGINRPVADLEGVAHRVDDGLAGQAEGADAKGRNAHVGLQGLH